MISIQQFKIESGIEMPPRSQASVFRKVAQSMKVGDSFLVPTCEERDRAMMTSGRQARFKFASRKINGEGYRIWRIK